MSVNKKEFADRMAAKGGIKKKDAMKGLDLFIETLLDCMSENEKVKLLNFGSFQMKTVKERIGRNPQTGQQCSQIPFSKYTRNYKFFQFHEVLLFKF